MRRRPRPMTYPPPSRTLVTATTLADLLGVKRQTVAAWANRGAIPSETITTANGYRVRRFDPKLSGSTISVLGEWS